MTEEIKSTEPKAAPKKSRKLIKFIFVLALIVAAAFWLWQEGWIEKIKKEFLTEHNTIYVNSDSFIDAAGSPGIQVDPITTSASEQNIQLGVLPSLLPPLVVENEAAQTPEAAPLEPSPETLLLKETTDNLVKNNRVIVLYIAMRDLKESLSDADRFSRELAFVKAQSLEYPELAGKVQILEIIDAQGLPTTNSVLAKIEKLNESLRRQNSNSFMENIKNSLSRLVTVSKLEGEIAAGDYSSVIKRTQIALEQDNLIKAQTEIAKLGEPGKFISEEIKNIINARKVVDDMTDNLKAKLIN